MRLVPQSLRRRGALLTATTAAVVAAIVTVLVLNSNPAAATWQSFAGTPTCDCVVQDTKNNTYRAVFGYVSTSKSAGKIDAGANNRLELTGGSRTDGSVTTRFEPGTHKASFSTGWVSKNTQITWKVGGKYVTATWNKPTCGKDVSLPAGGNGSGPIVALLFAALIGGAVFLWRKRRAAAQ
ncbi:hypothetical protein AB0F81_39445 [Actinoplanes sp. NPDC024001]|uniref:hypothetical protein n=1 Tax=Actinoplanes sp. NPDC024001 TaxID=3154598 RepID=UPI0034033A0F